jgi:hypothetical protein
MFLASCARGQRTIWASFPHRDSEGMNLEGVTLRGSRTPEFICQADFHSGPMELSNRNGKGCMATLLLVSTRIFKPPLG